MYRQAGTGVCLKWRHAKKSDQTGLGVSPTWKDRGWGPGARDTFLGFNHTDAAAAAAGWRGAACFVQAHGFASRGVSAPAQALTLTFSGTSSFSASGSSFSVTCGWCSGGRVQCVGVHAHGWRGSSVHGAVHGKLTALWANSSLPSHRSPLHTAAHLDDLIQRRGGAQGGEALPLPALGAQLGGGPGVAAARHHKHLAEAALGQLAGHWGMEGRGGAQWVCGL